MMNVIYCGFPDNYYEENNKKQLLNLEVRQYLSNKNHSAVFKKVASIDNIDMFLNSKSPASFLTNSIAPSVLISVGVIK